MSYQVLRENSSFRDKEGFVFYAEDGTVYRKILDDHAILRMNKFLSSSLKTVLGDRLIKTGLQNDIMTHERAVVTYPYEWSLSMLADAALTQLSVMKEILKEGYILKDGSGFNCLYHKGKMTFIDILSIGDLSDSSIWEGYHQFCEHFLYPLMLKVYKKINFQSAWRGSMDGLSTNDFRGMINIFDYCKKGIFLHSILKSKLTKSVGLTDDVKMKLTPENALQTISKLVNNLIALIEHLSVSYSSSIWTDYACNNTYTDGKYEQKKDFIKEFVMQLDSNFSLVDLGCNTGDFSEIASQHLALVKAVDFDADCIDLLYLRIKKGDLKNTIVPIVADLMNPSPSMGWHLSERKDLITRLQSNAFLALALIHHLCVAKNVPISYFVEFLGTIAPEGVVEWVSIEDPMVQV
ncbi:MAG: hypothetical protein WCN27_06475, partial [Alphaproteobacteria bacterium]